MGSRIRIHVLAAAALFTLVTLGEKVQAFDLQLRGFADLIGSTASTSYPLNNLKNNGKVLTVDSESRLGLNLSADLGNDFFFASQLLGQGASGGVYSLVADWIFVTYKPIDGLAIRAGRQISPIFLFSERIDVGFTYLWTRLPYEVYNIYPLESFNGVAFIYTVPINDKFQLRSEIYGGGGDQTINESGAIISGHNNDVKGLEVALLSEAAKVRIGYTSSHPDGVIKVNVPIAPGSPVTGTVNSPIDIQTLQVFSAGVSLDYKDFVGIAEWAHEFSPGTLARESTGAYAAVGYHLSPKLTPYVSYAWEWGLDGTFNSFPDPSVSTSQKTKQHSYVAGVNFNASVATILKAEYMRTQEYFAASEMNFGADVYTLSINVVF